MFFDQITIRGNTIDKIYQLAADMGSPGYIFTGEHDAGLMRDSTITTFTSCTES